MSNHRNRRKLIEELNNLTEEWLILEDIEDEISDPSERLEEIWHVIENLLENINYAEKNN